MLMVFVLGMAGGKYRSFLIHVKAANDRGVEELCNGARPVVRIPSLKPQSVKGHSLASLLAKVVPGKVWEQRCIVLSTTQGFLSFFFFFSVNTIH